MTPEMIEAGLFALGLYLAGIVAGIVTLLTMFRWLDNRQKNNGRKDSDKR